MQASYHPGTARPRGRARNSGHEVESIYPPGRAISTMSRSARFVGSPRPVTPVTPSVSAC